MPVRTAQAVWEGGLKDGKGNMRFESGAFDGEYSFSSRFEEGAGTNPEELIAAAHAGCFSMALSGELGKAGHTPRRIATSARVHIVAGQGITRIELHTTGEVPGIDADAFRRHAEAAVKGCPVSKALAAVEISVEARLAD